MVLYNITINLEEEIEKDWIAWMKETHIPDVMSTGYFKEFRFMKMISNVSEDTGKTYAIQFMADSLAQLDIYLKEEALALQKQSHALFGTRALAFRTVLEEI